jgi:hypothetical protein
MSRLTNVAAAAAFLAPVERWYRQRAATLTQRAEGDALAADALALVVDSGMGADQIRRAVMALAGWPTVVDDHDVHAVCTKAMFDRAELHQVGDPKRCRP